MFKRALGRVGYVGSPFGAGLFVRSLHAADAIAGKTLSPRMSHDFDFIEVCFIEVVHF